MPTPRSAATSPISELNARSREIFRVIVDGYVATGEPIGSRTLSRLLPQNLSHGQINANLGLPSTYTKQVSEFMSAL